MGLYFAKYGRSQDNHAQVSQIWKTRKHLKDYYNAHDTAHEICQKVFVKKYGVKYETEMYISERSDKFCELHMDCVSDVPDKKEAESFWASMSPYVLGDTLAQESLDAFFFNMRNHIQNWWD